MANTKPSLNYSRIACNIFTTDLFRKIVRKARHNNFTEEQISKIKLIVIVIQLFIHRSNTGYYTTYDDDFFEAIAEESSVDDDTTKATIEFLVEENYYHTFESPKVITSVEIQDAYFSAMARLKRIKPTDAPYLLVDISKYYHPYRAANVSSSEEMTHSSEERTDSSEITAHSSEERTDSSEDRAGASKESLLSSEDRRDTSEGRAQSNSIRKRRRNETYIDSIYSSCSKEQCDYNNNEKYNFYLIMFMENVKDPAKATEDFVAYNQAQSWTSPKNKTKYDTPSSRCALAKRYADKSMTPKGRLVAHDELHEKVNTVFLQCLYDLYLWAKHAQIEGLPPHIIMNANSKVIYKQVDEKQFDLELVTGLKAKQVMEDHLDEIKPIVLERFFGLRNLSIIPCKQELQSMTP